MGSKPCPPHVPSFLRGSVSRIGGMSLQDLQREAEATWAKGFPEKVGTEGKQRRITRQRPPTSDEDGEGASFAYRATKL